MINYGINPNNKQAVVFDRVESGEAMHRAIFGMSGLHFLMKSEVLQLLKNTEDNIYILDCGGDFKPIVDKLDAYYIKVKVNDIGGVTPFVIPKKYRLVVMDISDFESCMIDAELKRDAVTLCLNAVWKAVEALHLQSKDKHFWFFVDDIYPILRASCDKLFSTMLASCRTKNCLVTYGGQFISDMYIIEYGKNILANTAMFTLLHQLRKNDIECLKLLLNLTDSEANSLTTNQGLSGLFCVNRRHIPFEYIYSQK